jgi:hypothetical protein
MNHRCPNLKVNNFKIPNVFPYFHIKTLHSLKLFPTTVQIKINKSFKILTFNHHKLDIQSKKLK